MFKRYKDLSDTELAKKRSFFKKFASVDNKISSPPSFLGLLVGSAALTLLFPAVPHLFLFCLCGAAGIAASSRFISVTGRAAVDDEMERRYPAPVAQAAASGTAPSTAPAVTQTPDLSEAFSRGVDNPDMMKPLRFKGPGQSSFLNG